MSLQTRITDFVTAVATDIKQLRTYITGTAGGDLTGLNTTSKSSVVSAINEVNNKVPPTTPTATESVSGTSRVATQTETSTATEDVAHVTPLKLQQKLTAWAQPLSANLTSLSGQASTAFGRARLNDLDAAAAKSALVLVKGDVGLGNVPNTDATSRSNHTGTQPATTITGLAAVATSGSASDITTGTLPTSVLPPLAINDVFTVASQTAMLALTAQRGDVAIRTDTNRSFILSADDATVLGNWKQVTAGGDVTSVNGSIGAVTINAASVGLGNVNNTADVDKPVSTAQQTAISARLLAANNLSDLTNVATARTNLSVYSQAEIGNPETDFAAAYATAKA